MLDGLNLDPGKVLFVGDTPRTDIEGPLAAEMKAPHVDELVAVMCPAWFSSCREYLSCEFSQHFSEELRGGYRRSQRLSIGASPVLLIFAFGQIFKNITCAAYSSKTSLWSLACALLYAESMGRRNNHEPHWI